MGKGKPARKLYVVLDRFAGYVDDHRHLPALPDRAVLLDDCSHAGVLQPDGVEHPARRLDDARRRIAGPWPQRRALAADSAEALHVHDLAVFDAVAERARGDKDRVWQEQTALRGDVHRQVDPIERLTLGHGRPGDGGCPEIGHGRRSGLNSRATGPRHRKNLLLGLHEIDSQEISSAANTGPSRQTRCGPSTPMTIQPRQAPTAQPIVCSIETCRKALRRAAVDPSGSALPPPLLRPSFATPRRSRRPRRAR